MEVDGNIVFFNEAEAVASLDEYVDEDEIRPRGRKTKGRREKDIQLSETFLLPQLPSLPISDVIIHSLFP